jgi:hypothetical protein
VNWTIEVAWHEVQTEWRRQARATPGEVPDLPDGPADPARVVEGRLTLDAAKQGIAAMNMADRNAILSSLDDQHVTAPATTASMKMRRLRARRRLTAALEETGHRWGVS